MFGPLLTESASRQFDSALFMIENRLLSTMNESAAPPVSDPAMLEDSTGAWQRRVKGLCLAPVLLQAPGPAEGVVGVAGGAAGSGLRAERGAEHLPAGADASGGGAEQPEGNQPEPGPQQRSAHQPVPGITQMLAHSHMKRRNTITNPP